MNERLTTEFFTPSCPWVLPGFSKETLIVALKGKGKRDGAEETLWWDKRKCYRFLLE